MSNLGKASAKWKGLPWYDEVNEDEGHRCGNCDRVLRIYHRKLTSSMCRSLVRLYKLSKKHPKKDEFHVKQFDREGARGEFGVLQKWGLVEPGTDMGMWSLTKFGKKFMKKKEKVPQYVVMKWGSQALGYAGILVSIKDALEETGRFKYSELIKK